MVEGHPALVAHDVLRLQMDFVDVLREIRVLALAVWAFGLNMHNIERSDYPFHFKSYLI